MPKRNTLLSVLACLVLLPVVGQNAPAPGGSTNSTLFTGGLVTGYYGGAGFHASIRASHLAQNLPVDLRFGIGYAKVEPGRPDEARRVFINDGTNGTPEESGKLWDFRFDLMRQVHWFNFKRAYLYGGPRHSRFTAHFAYVGGNEVFDITSHQWGIGSGLENSFALSPRVDLVFTGGADYFFGSKLEGHDTSYSPSNDNVNPREGYAYSDADKAINQPKLELRLMFGLAYRF